MAKPLLNIFLQVEPRRAAGFLFFVMLIGCSANDHHRSGLHQVLSRHLDQYPAMRIEDAYKLIYQGALGIEHLLTDTTAAINYLHDEWNKIPANEDEPLYEMISPDSQWVRLNLKPYKAAGGHVEAVWRAMLRSSRTATDQKEFLQRWQEFISLVNEKKLPFDSQELRDFDNRIALAHYPLTHHSQEYTRAYEPAYRVLLFVEARRLQQLIPAKNPF
ncbi:hypothetical protein L0337_31655 [candidate division KSB1 bacterium]|nr:hypothetical protein [candidate division KSB1 bacterium]